MSKRKRMFPNGYGGISKLSGKRRRPYMAYITTGWDLNGKQIKKPIGYGRTSTEASQILIKYNEDKYNIDYSKLTYEDICYKILDKFKNEALCDESKKKTYELYKASINNHCFLIKNINVLKIRKRDIQRQIDVTEEGYSTKKYIKSLAAKVYLYLTDDLDLPIKKDFSKNLDIGEKPTSVLHKDFNEEELAILWQNSDNYYIKLALIMCYTGLRPSELIKIKIKDINLEERYMIGGLKTKAGKNRLIPICKRILPIIEEIYSQDNNYLVTGVKDTNITYKTLRINLSNFFNELDLNHLPHDCRHTFATRMDRLRCNKLTLKLILGHSTKNDVTDDVYIHKNINDYLQEVDKLN